MDTQDYHLPGQHDQKKHGKKGDWGEWFVTEGDSNEGADFVKAELDNAPQEVREWVYKAGLMNVRIVKSPLANDPGTQEWHKGKMPYAAVGLHIPAHGRLFLTWRGSDKTRQTFWHEIGHLIGHSYVGEEAAARIGYKGSTEAEEFGSAFASYVTGKAYTEADAIPYAELTEEEMEYANQSDCKWVTIRGRRVCIKEKGGGFIKTYLPRTEIAALAKKMRTTIANNCKRFELCGSYRREEQMVGDMDFVVQDADFDKILAGLKKKFTVVGVPRKGEKLMTVTIKHENITLQVDFNNATSKNYGAALLASSGNKQFQIGLRTLARQKGFTFSSKGLTKLVKGKHGDYEEKVFAGKTEEEVFKVLGMKYVPPKLRKFSFWWAKDKFKAYAYMDDVFVLPPYEECLYHLPGRHDQDTHGRKRGRKADDTEAERQRKLEEAARAAGEVIDEQWEPDQPTGEGHTVNGVSTFNGEEWFVKSRIPPQEVKQEEGVWKTAQALGWTDLVVGTQGGESASRSGPFSTFFLVYEKLKSGGNFINAIGPPESPRLAKMLADEPRLSRLFMLEFIVGAYDRHGANYWVDKDGKAYTLDHGQSWTTSANDLSLFERATGLWEYKAGTRWESDPLDDESVIVKHRAVPGARVVTIPRSMITHVLRKSKAISDASFSYTRHVTKTRLSKLRALLRAYPNMQEFDILYPAPHTDFNNPWGRVIRLSDFFR